MGLRMKTPDSLDLALIRWSVTCQTWQEMAAGNTPDLGAFLSGWFWRTMGNLHPPAVIEGFRDSFRKGFAEADWQLSIFTQSANTRAPSPGEAALLAALQDAENALANSYDVQEYPGDGKTIQDKALASVRAALSAAQANERE